MNPTVSGSLVKQKRKALGLTQSQLAEKLGVSDKTVSKWETGRGFPDVSFLPALTETLGLSPQEWMQGEAVANRNRSANIKHTRFYVCPVCGNILTSVGEAVISCCGLTLPPLTSHEPDADHTPSVETVEDELYLTFPHEMTKEHYLSFVAALSSDRLDIVKLYPESDAALRLPRRATESVLVYCNRHGLFCIKR